MRRRFMSNKKTKSVKYCTITATQDNTSISSANFLDIYYAINNTDYWSCGSTLIFATLNAGDSIYLKRSIDFGVANAPLYIDCDKDVILSGNILSLVFGDNNSNETSLSHIKGSIASFSNVIKVSSDFLPSKELGAMCYESMFANCPRLTQAPELPATTLAPYCYRNMFTGCTNLNYIKMLATDISASGCLYIWVGGVSSTGTFVKNKDATWNTTPGALGTSGVPAGWTVVDDEEEGKTINNVVMTVEQGGMLRPLTVTMEYPASSLLKLEYSTDKGITWREHGATIPIGYTTFSNTAYHLLGDSVQYRLNPSEDDVYIYQFTIVE